MTDGELGMFPGNSDLNDRDYCDYHKKNQVRLQEFLSPLEICDSDKPAASAYGDIRRGLEKNGEPIGAMDLLIAAHALGHGWTLVTNNEAEFKCVKGLKVENWV